MVAQHRVQRRFQARRPERSLRGDQQARVARGVDVGAVDRTGRDRSPAARPRARRAAAGTHPPPAQRVSACAQLVALGVVDQVAALDHGVRGERVDRAHRRRRAPGAVSASCGRKVELNGAPKRSRNGTRAGDSASSTCASVTCPSVASVRTGRGVAAAVGRAAPRPPLQHAVAAGRRSVASSVDPPPCDGGVEAAAGQREHRDGERPARRAPQRPPAARGPAPRDPAARDPARGRARQQQQPGGHRSAPARRWPDAEVGVVGGEVRRPNGPSTSAPAARDQRRGQDGPRRARQQERGARRAPAPQRRSSAERAAALRRGQRQRLDQRVQADQRRRSRRPRAARRQRVDQPLALAGAPADLVGWTAGALAAARGTASRSRPRRGARRSAAGAPAGAAASAARARRRRRPRVERADDARDAEARLAAPLGSARRASSRREAELRRQAAADLGLAVAAQAAARRTAAGPRSACGRRGKAITRAISPSEKESAAHVQRGAAAATPVDALAPRGPAAAAAFSVSG